MNRTKRLISEITEFLENPIRHGFISIIYQNTIYMVIIFYATFAKTNFLCPNKLFQITFLNSFSRYFFLQYLICRNLYIRNGEIFLCNNIGIQIQRFFTYTFRVESAKTLNVNKKLDCRECGGFRLLRVLKQII